MHSVHTISVADHGLPVAPRQMTNTATQAEPSRVSASPSMVRYCSKKMWKTE
jgi:hypothetical protein